MVLLTEFAEAMTEYEQSKGIPGGYRTRGKEPYRFYMSNEAWQAMLDGMEEIAKEQYGQGSGGELEEKDGKPPKMAAFFSSSRMLYLLSKDLQGFEFEKKLPTYVGGTANLDGYLAVGHSVVFAEAKCREIYGHKTPERISDKYLKVYEYLTEKMPDVFDFQADSLGNGYSNVAFFCKNKPVEGFDLKQMICHLLAVAGSLLQKEEDPGPVKFLYVIYDPQKLPLKPESGEKIREIHKRVLEDAGNLDIKRMFGHIVDYLISLKKFEIKADADLLKYRFEFINCTDIEYARTVL